MSKVEKQVFTQLPLEAPDNYIDGNADWLGARDYAISQGWPARSVCQVENDLVMLIRDETLDPWELRSDKETPANAIVCYVVKTVESGYIIVPGTVSEDGVVTLALN